MSNPTKQCSKCKEIKELGEFYRRCDSKSGLASNCKSCINKRRKVYYNRLAEDRVIASKFAIKSCRKCKERKRISNFSKSHNTKDGLHPACKSCEKISKCIYKELPPNPVSPLKTCSRCNIQKPPTEFNRCKGGKDGFMNQCKTCSWERHIKRTFGLDVEDYRNILKSQNGKCAICETNTPNDFIKNAERRVFNVDHSHETGKIRGLLCGPCNRALGLLKDDPEILDRAARYIRVRS